MCIRVCTYMWMWRPEVHIKCLPPSCSMLCFTTRSLTDLDLTHLLDKQQGILGVVLSLPQFWDDRFIRSLLTFPWHRILNSGPHTCIACTFPTESPSTPDRMPLSQHCSVDALDTSSNASAPAWSSLNRKSQITMNS